MNHPRKHPRPPAELLDFGRALRRQGTDAEALLWHFIRDRRFGGFKFRRQHPVAPYVLDFYCAEARLAIELDGGQHAEQAERDAARDRFLVARRIRVLRFWNDQVFKETENVLAVIWRALFLLPGGRRCPEGADEGDGVAPHSGHHPHPALARRPLPQGRGKI